MVLVLRSSITGRELIRNVLSSNCPATASDDACARPQSCGAAVHGLTRRAGKQRRREAVLSNRSCSEISFRGLSGNARGGCVVRNLPLEGERRFAEQFPARFELTGTLPPGKSANVLSTGCTGDEKVLVPPIAPRDHRPRS